MTDLLTITQETIQRQIYTIRGKQVMMDRDLAVLYGVETRAINQAVKRNQERFPESFSFLLTEEELSNLRSQTVISSFDYGGRRYTVRVFAEQGVAMLSAVLRSETAVKISVQIMTAFVEMRKLIADNAVVYHIGASLKDLALRWFAFSKMEVSALEMLSKIVV